MLDLNLWGFVLKKNMTPELSAISEHPIQIARTTKLDTNQPTVNFLLVVMQARWQGKVKTVSNLSCKLLYSEVVSLRLSTSVLVFEKPHRAQPSLHFTIRLVGKLLTNLYVSLLTSLLKQKWFKVTLLPLCRKLQPPENCSHPGSRHPYFQHFPPTCVMKYLCYSSFLPVQSVLRPKNPQLLPTNLFQDPFASISTPSLSTVHAVPPPLKLSQPLLLLYLHCPFPRVSMYPTATDFYLTLFPLQTHTQKR